MTHFKTLFVLLLIFSICFPVQSTAFSEPKNTHVTGIFKLYPAPRFTFHSKFAFHRASQNIQHFQNLQDPQDMFNDFILEQNGNCMFVIRIATFLFHHQLMVSTRYDALSKRVFSFSLFLFFDRKRFWNVLEFWNQVQKDCQIQQSKENKKRGWNFHASACSKSLSGQ